MNPRFRKFRLDTGKSYQEIIKEIEDRNKRFNRIIDYISSEIHSKEEYIELMSVLNEPLIEEEKQTRQN